MYDVIVIGGGIAGAATAIALAGQGMRLLVLEAGHYPRHKMCGEFLSPESVPILKRLGVWEAVTTLDPPGISALRLTSPDGASLDSPLPPGAIGISRYQLDFLLVDRARQLGAEVREGCAASDVTGSFDQGFVVRTARGEVRSRVVVGAWGKRATVDRTLQRPFFRADAPFLALKRHARAIEPNAIVELHGFKGGYCGISAIEGGVVNVCLLTTQGAWERGGKSVGAFWRMIQGENALLGQRLQGAEQISDDIVISNISFAPRAPVENDILMVGDCAALISPFAGNGQAMALQAAEEASRLVASYFSGEITAQRLKIGYARYWRAIFGERLRLGKWLQPLLLNPRALGMAIRAGKYAPAVVQQIVAGTRARRESPSTAQ